MARRRLPRGTTAAMAGTVLLEGEIAYDTIADRLKVGNGVAAGGKGLAYKQELDAASATANAAATQAALSALAQTVNGKVDEADLEALDDRVAAQEALGSVGVKFIKQAIRVRSTANVAIATGLENGDTLNGVTLATGNHVFLGSQTAPAENGLYTVVASGAASRATFADSAAELSRIGFLIQTGTVGAGERWTLAMEAADITVGTTALEFSPVGIEVSVASELAALTDVVDALKVGSGNMMRYWPLVRGLAGGAQPVVGNDWAFMVPAAATGNFSNLAARWRADFSGRAGQVVRFTFVSQQDAADVGAGFTRDVYPRLQAYSEAAPLGEFRTGTYSSLPPTTPGLRVDTVTYEIVGDELQIEPLLLLNDGTGAASNETLTPLFVGYDIISGSTVGTETVQELVVNDRDGRFAGRLGVLGGYDKYDRIVTVKTSAGDFDNVQAAIDAVIGATATRRVGIEIYPGLPATELEIMPKDFVDLIGVGAFGAVEIAMILPDDASNGDIEFNSGIYLGFQADLLNLKIRVRNARYGVHWESSATRPYNLTRIDRCIIIHEGNEDAVNNDWEVESQMAIGAGQSNGEIMLLTNSLCFGPGGGVSVHSPNIVGGHRRATRLRAESCLFAATAPTGFGVKVVPITLGAGSWVELIGCGIVQGILYESSQWISADVATSRAQFAMFGHGNRGAVFHSVMDGPAAGALFRPMFSDEERPGLNATGSPIVRKSVLAWADSGRLSVRKMADDDAAALYAGVAIEDIAAGAVGRVKTGGELALAADVLRSGAESLSIGDTFSLSATDGTVALGGTQGLLEVQSVVNGLVAVKVAR